jgi:hypothetical protein
MKASILAATLLWAAPGLLFGAEAPKTRSVVADPQYASSGTHKWLFGADYRYLWTIPVTVEILDLQNEAGGLSPVRRVGGQQTKGLALKGKDGKNYTFRGLDKDATELVEEELRGTVVERTLQDQMAAQHPASEAIARVILDAAGIPCPAWRLVVLPDDPALGQFQKDFSGAIGMFAEYPSAVSDTNPGFRGITEIIDHEALYKKLQAGVEDRADVQALLKARLVDIFMGDWDRHRKQWRWAKFPGNPLWVPIPEDRDQAFSRYEGLVLGSARRRDPRFQNLKAKYPKMVGLTLNGWEQDRRLLVGLTREDFQRTAVELRGLITDDVLQKAVAAMPPEWAKLDGPRLLADLKGRRNALPEAAEKYYRHLADRVDIYMTDQPERIDVTRDGNGNAEVTVAVVGADGKPGEPYYRRVFHSKETEELRLYALGGDDKVVVSGGSKGPRVRVVGGAGNDTLDARNGGKAKLSDSEGNNHAEGAGLDGKAYVAPPPPKNAPWIPPRDWGSQTWFTPWLSYSGDTGVFVGGGIEHREFGFREDPYSSRHVFRAGYAFGEKNGKAEYSGDYRRENHSSYWGLHAFVSGVEVLRFYGYGNETTNNGDKDFYKVSANQILVYPSMSLRFGKRATFTLGPAGKFTQSKTDKDEFINLVQPYGTGDFGEVGAHAIFSVDGRDSLSHTRRGFFAAVRGTVYPKAWDVQDTFGETNANLNGYVSAGKWLTLAVRAGGKKVFGTYPYMEAASIGSGGLGVGALAEPDYTVRGFRSRRFLGDASAWGNADLRLTISRITLILPANWGVFGFADSGRVWLKGEDSNTWHTGVGGGIWISLLNYRSTFSSGIAHSKEDDLFYVTGGFTF